MTPSTRVRLLATLGDFPHPNRILRVREVRGDRADVLELEAHSVNHGLVFETPKRCALHVPLDQLEVDDSPYLPRCIAPEPREKAGPPKKPTRCKECFGSGMTRITIAFPEPEVRDVVCGMCAGEGEVAA